MLRPGLIMERPLLFIVRKPEHALGREKIIAFLAAQAAKWWVPDKVIFLEGAHQR